MTYFTSIQIEANLRENFSRIYKAFGDFIDSGDIWNLCIDTIKNTDVLNKIIFCNDIHKIPPVNTFLKVQGSIRDLTELEKRSIGAFWGFVFKYVFGYRNQKSVAARVNTVKTATFFFDVACKIEVIPCYSERLSKS